MLDKGMTNVLGGTEQDGERFHHPTQKGVQFKNYRLFTSEIFIYSFQTTGNWKLTVKTWIRELSCISHFIDFKQVLLFKEGLNKESVFQNLK